jgi:REP element-mobilizing transposase RayT
MGRELYRGKYSTGSRRMPGWDYTRKAYYSITINTRKKGNILGEIVEGKMNLNAPGKIADEYAVEIPKHFLHVKLHEYVVMPDHVHLLLEIFKNLDQITSPKNEYSLKNGKTEQSSVSGSNMVNENNTNDDGNIYMETEPCSVSSSFTEGSLSIKKYRHKSGSIPVIIRSYKSICTREIHKLKGQEYFKWQASFYDEVIFDEQYFQNTQSYIRSNPKKYHAK